MAWITSTVEDDLEILEEMFWPTKEEIEKQQKKCSSNKMDARIQKK